MNLDFLDRVRRPEYTGRNRCWPCAITNAVILALAGALVTVASVPLALVLLSVGSAAIWLRGYLVPYTPRFAPALVEYLPISFSKSGPPDEPVSITETGSDDAAPDGEAVLAALLDADVLDADETAVTLSPSFRDVWTREQRELRDASGGELAATIEATTPDGVTARTQGVDGELLLVEGRGGGVTLPRQIAIAEAAATAALAEVAPGLPTAVRTNAARPLRGFLETCPACDADVVETTPRNCCGTTSPRDLADRVLACPSCDRRLYTFPE